MPKRLANGTPFQKSTASAATLTVSRSAPAKLLLACIEEKFTPAMFWGKITELLNAQRTYVTKDKEVIEVPDYNAQLATTKFLYEAVVGRPKEREDTPDEKKATDMDGIETLRRMCEMSPIFTAEVEKILQQVKGKNNAIES